MVELELYKGPHLGRSREEDGSKKVDFEERSIVILSCLDDFVHPRRLKRDAGCDPIYAIQCEGEDLINKLGHDVEVNLENHDKRTTSPSLEECEVTCPLLYDRVILEMEYSLPCSLKSIPLTYQCPHLFLSSFDL
jgi:hypothetical protein